MRSPEAILEELKRRGIVIGPGHFVLGDGYGKPAHHSRLFVDWKKFNDAVDLYAELVEMLAEHVVHARFDMIVTSDDDSLPSARMLAKVISSRSFAPPAPCFSFESRNLPPKGRYTVLIHDDFINNGRQANELLIAFDQGVYHPVGITALFTRVGGGQLFNLPIFAAIAEPLEAFPTDRLPPDLAATPVNTDYGKGKQFLELQGK